MPARSKGQLVRFDAREKSIQHKSLNKLNVGRKRKAPVLPVHCSLMHMWPCRQGAQIAAPASKSLDPNVNKRPWDVPDQLVQFTMPHPVKYRTQSICCQCLCARHHCTPQEETQILGRVIVDAIVLNNQ